MGMIDVMCLSLLFPLSFLSLNFPFLFSLSYFTLYTEQLDSRMDHLEDNKQMEKEDKRGGPRQNGR